MIAMLMRAGRVELLRITPKARAEHNLRALNPPSTRSRQ